MAMAAPLPLDIFAQLGEERVVQIQTKLGIGHGVFINSEGLILTVAHLFSKYEKQRLSSHTVVGDEVIVYTHGSSILQFNAVVRSVVPGYDVALLQILKPVEGKVEKLKFKYASLASECSVGQRVFMISSRDRVVHHLSTGTIAFESRITPWLDSWPYFWNTPFVQVLNIHSIPGESGSPIFDWRGRIVGILSSTVGNMDMFIHFSCLREYLRSYHNKHSPGHSGLETMSEHEVDTAGTSRGRKRRSNKEVKKQKKQQRKMGRR